MVMAGSDLRTLLNRYPRILRVGRIAGGEAEFITVRDALVQAALMGPAAANKVVILLGPGAPYPESNLTWVNGIDLVAFGDPEACQIVASDPANPIITVPNGVTCTLQGVRVENTNAGAAPAVRAIGATLVIRDCFLKAAAAAGTLIPALHLATTASAVTVQRSYIEAPSAIRLEDVAHTFLCERSRINGGSYLALIHEAGHAATFIACDGLSTGQLNIGAGTLTCKQCSRWGATIRSDGGTAYLDHCDCNALLVSGTIIAVASSVTSINMQNAASSLTMDEACSISGAITNVAATATLILPRKRMGAGLGAPGLLADATQMDSVVGAGAPINQAPATRTTTDWPRTVKVVHTGAVTGFPYTITLTGTGMLKGALVAVTEVITITGAQAFRGVVAWHNISNWTSSGNIGVGDTVALQFDSRLGLEHRLRDTTHLLACRKSPGGAAPRYMAPADFTLNLTQQTIEETVVVVVAGDTYEYWIVKG